MPINLANFTQGNKSTVTLLVVLGLEWLVQ